MDASDAAHVAHASDPARRGDAHHLAPLDPANQRKLLSTDLYTCNMASDSRGTGFTASPAEAAHLPRAEKVAMVVPQVRRQLDTFPHRKGGMARSHVLLQRLRIERIGEEDRAACPCPWTLSDDADPRWPYNPKEKAQLYNLE